MSGTVSSILRQMTSVLEHSLGPEATSAARAIACDYFGYSFTQLVTHYPDAIDADVVDVLLGQADLVSHDIPLQYVTGKASFAGLDIHVEPGVLIPRPETEGLVELVSQCAKDQEVDVLDIGTGSGCIALALSNELPSSSVMAIDASEDAVRIAQENATRLALDVDICKMDVFSADMDSLIESNGPFDVVVSNPPYIKESERKDMRRNVLDHEPEMALFVPDADPLVFYRRIARLCRAGLLASDGSLFFEINEALGKEMESMLRAEGFSKVEIHKDYVGKDRFAVASL